MKPKTRPHQPPVVPRKFAGQWVAWNHDQTKIIASGRTIRDALAAARATGEPDPLLDKAPRADVRFIGGLRA